MPSRPDHLKGLLITGIGGLVLSVDIPLIRLTEGDPWPVLLVRSGTTLLAALVIWVVWRSLSPRVPRLVPGRSGILVASLYGMTSICFILAVFNTSTANLAFLLAFNPVFAAGLAWLFLRERPRNVTLLAMAMMVVGVMVIVGDGIQAGSMLGDGLALLTALFLAGAITVTRASGRDMGLAALTGVLLPFIVAAIMTAKTGYRIDAPWWIIFNGAIVMPFASYCLATGPRYLSAPEVAMFYLLETVLAPIWVWMIFMEVPSRNALVGGMVLVVALVAHSIWQLIDGRRRIMSPDP